VAADKWLSYRQLPLAAHYRHARGKRLLLLGLRRPSPHSRELSSPAALPALRPRAHRGFDPSDPTEPRTGGRFRLTRRLARSATTTPGGIIVIGGRQLPGWPQRPMRDTSDFV
jgi:hypothetical protein